VRGAEAGEGVLPYRPQRYVPVRVPIVDREAIEAVREQRKRKDRKSLAHRDGDTQVGLQTDPRPRRYRADTGPSSQSRLRKGSGVSEYWIRTIPRLIARKEQGDPGRSEAYRCLSQAAPGR